MGLKGIIVCFAVALALFAGVVLFAIHRPPKPRGFSGLEFAALTPAASARTPLLARGGALVYQVADDSPADKAEDQARRSGGGDRRRTGAVGAPGLRHGARAIAPATVSPSPLYDVTKGEVKPETVSLTFEDAAGAEKDFLGASAAHPGARIFPAAHAGRQCVLVAAHPARAHHPPAGADGTGGRGLQRLCAGGMAGRGASRPTIRCFM